MKTIDKILGVQYTNLLSFFSIRKNKKIFFSFNCILYELRYF